MLPNKQTEEIKLIDGQIIASFLFIISIAISIALLYNQKLNVLNEEPLFSRKETNKIALYNKIFSIILLAYFLYVSYQTYEETKDTEKGSDAQIQLIASSIVTFAAFLGLYIILKNYNTNLPFIDVENPEI